MLNKINNLGSTDKVVSFDQIPAEGFLRLKQIVAPDGPLPISRSAFWAGVKMGKFPQAYKISPRVTVWKVEDIRELISRICEGDH